MKFIFLTNKNIVSENLMRYLSVPDIPNRVYFSTLFSIYKIVDAWGESLSTENHFKDGEG